MLHMDPTIRFDQPYIRPKPGSPSAIEQGCRCDAAVNHNGYGAVSKGVYILSSDCIMHTLKPKEKF